MLTLFVPLTLAALGIVLRGSSFAFRKVLVRTPQQRVFGGLFAISSVIVPYCMGAVAGAIASGRVPSGGKAGDPWSSWVNPTSILGGVLAVTACSYLAAVYLVWDARRLSDDAMVEYFRTRGDRRRRHGRGRVRRDLRVPRRRDLRLPRLDLARTPARHHLGPVRGDLTVDARARRPPGARVLSAGAVATVIWAWGVAQWEYILPTSLKVSDAAAPSGTLTAVLVVFAVAAVTIVPALWFLYILDQKSLLPQESVGADS